MAPVTSCNILWNSSGLGGGIEQQWIECYNTISGEGGGGGDRDRANKEKGGNEQKEKERRRKGGLPMCLAMAFGGRVPVVVGWEFPSVPAERETTEDVFFLADQECPDLEVFPPLTLSLCQSFYSNATNCCPSLLLWISASVTPMHKHLSREASKEENISHRGTGMSSLNHPAHPLHRLDYTSQHAPPNNSRCGP